MGCTILVGGHRGARRNPVGVTAGQHLVVGIQQQGHAAAIGCTAASKNAGHLSQKIKGQAQHTAGLAGLRVQHALCVEQCLGLVWPQVAVAKGFHKAVARQGLRQQGVVRAIDRRGLINLRDHGACQIQQHDLVVDRVFALVFAQPVNDAGLVADARHIVAQGQVCG